MGTNQTIGRHKTKVRHECGTTTVRYHNTDVVTFDAETITLRTGGWRTVTTKARMNQTANVYDLGFYVFQKDFEWFVKTAHHTVPFGGDSLVLKRAMLLPVTPEKLTQST
jgi:hypothetical protein